MWHGARSRNPAKLIIMSKALVDKGFCVSKCHLALNVINSRYVLSSNKCNLCRYYSSCQQGNLCVDMSFIHKCHDILTHCCQQEHLSCLLRFSKRNWCNQVLPTNVHLEASITQVRVFDSKFDHLMKIQQNPNYRRQLSSKAWYHRRTQETLLEISLSRANIRATSGNVIMPFFYLKIPSTDSTSTVEPPCDG